MMVAWPRNFWIVGAIALRGVAGGDSVGVARRMGGHDRQRRGSAAGDAWMADRGADELPRTVRAGCRGGPRAADRGGRGDRGRPRTPSRAGAALPARNRRRRPAQGSELPASLRRAASAAHPDARWMPFEADQQSFADQPTRLFLMRARMFGMPVEAFHRLIGGRATMQVKIAGADSDGGRPRRRDGSIRDRDALQRHVPARARRRCSIQGSCGSRSMREQCAPGSPAAGTPFPRRCCSATTVCSPTSSPMTVRDRRRTAGVLPVSVSLHPCATIATSDPRVSQRTGRRDGCCRRASSHMESSTFRRWTYNVRR